MIDELEALIGYVYVVGGRAVSATPPGALVELPPKKPQRGRDQDTFFTLVTPAGTNQGQANFYEQLARLAADLYFRTSGGVTSGLREAIGVVNNNLIEHNVVAGQRYEANMICLILRGHEAYVARAGSCVCLFRQGDTFLSLPDDLRDEYALNGLPLGYSPVPDIKLSHYEVAPGHVMVLGDSQFAQADRSSLSDALGAGDIQAILEPLRELAGDKPGAKAQAVVIEFVSIDTPDPTVQTPQPGMQIMRSSAAPAAVPAAPLSATGASAQSSEPAESPASTPKQRSRPKLGPFGRGGGSQAAPKPASRLAQPAPAIVSSPSSPLSSSMVSTASAASVAAEPLPVREIVAETTQNAELAGRKVAGGTASVLSFITKGLSAALDRVLPEPDDNGPKIPAMLAAALAILVPVIVVFFMIALRLSKLDETSFEKTVEDVQQSANQAATIPLSDINRAKTAWLGVLQRIENAEVTSGRTNDDTLRRIRIEAQAVLDGYDKVTRRPAIVLRNFAEGAKLIGPVLQGGTTMYTLDLKTSAIYRDTLNPNATSVAARASQPVVQQGQAVGSHTVTKLIDMIWMPEGGVPRGANVLAALDPTGLLVTYSPTFAPATSETLPGVDQWLKPVAITSWQGRFYVLDVGANQIWRYQPSGESYPNEPEPYFASDFRPDLKNAISLAIDSTGNVFILFADGTMKKYNGGTEQPFSFNGLPDGSLKSASAMFLDDESNLPAIYITDPLDQSVYQVTLAGTFRYRFRSADPTAFRQLSGIFVDQDRVFVASGSLVYTFTLNDTTGTPTPGP